MKYLNGKSCQADSDSYRDEASSRTITLRQVQGDIHFEMTLKIINENIGI